MTTPEGRRPFSWRTPAFLERGTPRLLSAAMLAIFMAALDQTIIGPVLGNMMADLGGGPLLAWVATGFLVAGTVTAPLYGAIADIRGRRQALLWANGLFLLGSVLCGLAPNLAVLVAGRVVQGAGAGGMIAIPFIIVADRVPMARRAVFSAYISALYAIAGLLGPLAGGLLADSVGWRGAFWINLLPGAMVIWGVTTAIAARAPSKGRQVDWLGGACLTVATLPTLMALQSLSSPEGALLPRPVLLIVALVFWVLFFVRMRRAADPLIPMAAFRNPTILLAPVGLAACQGTNLGLTIYLPLYFQQEFGLGASGAGTMLLALVMGVMFGAFAPPRLLLRNPAYKGMMIWSSSLGIASAVLLCLTMALLPQLWLVVLASAALGASIGFLYPIFTLAVQNAAPPELMGAAIGALAFMRSIGATLGVSLTGVAALGTGLAEAGSGEGLPMWTLALPAIGLMTLSLIANAALPAKRLEGYAPEAKPAVEPA